MFMGGLRKRNDFIENIKNIVENNQIEDKFIIERLTQFLSSVDDADNCDKIYKELLK